MQSYVFALIFLVVLGLICAWPWITNPRAEKAAKNSQWDEKLPGGYRMFDGD